MLLFTLLVGTLGGFIFFKLKVPAGMLVGAIFAVSALSVATPYALMPMSAKVAAQIITGAYIGSTISKSDILHLPRIIGPYLVVMITFFMLNVISGLLIHLLSPLDLLTSLLCALPGGISDTPLIAMDMGADAAKVAVLQFVRMVFGLGALPLLIVAVDRMVEKREKHGDQQTPSEIVAPKSAAKQAHAPIALILTLAASAAGGFLGKWLGVPAGTLIFSMLVTIGFKMLYSKAYLPLWCRRVAQVLSGCCIGSQMTYNDVVEIRYLLLPAAILIVGYFVNCVVVGWLLHRCFKMPRLEAMLCVSPAGATEMALISADLGVNSPDLIAIQICRLVGVMAVFPQLISLLLTFIE
ncbi:MAG TPA: AbrB family transcriptional regulator [Clostridia bacterium]|nr:AbrB family transcriptional regulator [Clostridia bacterium]